MPTSYLPYNPTQGYDRDLPDPTLLNGTGMRGPAPRPTGGGTLALAMQPPSAPRAAYNPGGFNAYRGITQNTPRGTPLPVGEGHSQAQFLTAVQQMASAGLLSPAMASYVSQPLIGGRGRTAGSDWQRDVMGRLTTATGIDQSQLSGIMGVANAFGSSPSDIWQAAGRTPPPGPPGIATGQPGGVMPPPAAMPQQGMQVQRPGAGSVSGGWGGGSGVPMRSVGGGGGIGSRAYQEIYNQTNGLNRGYNPNAFSGYSPADAAAKAGSWRPPARGGMPNGGVFGGSSIFSPSRQGMLPARGATTAGSMAPDQFDMSQYFQ